MTNLKNEHQKELINQLLDHIIHCLDLTNDRSLSEALNIAPQMTSAIRKGRLDIGPSMLLKISEVTGWEASVVTQYLSDNLNVLPQHTTGRVLPKESNKHDPLLANVGMLFDKIMLQFNLKNDAALARFLNIQPPVISLLRKGTTTFGRKQKEKIVLATNWPESEIEGYQSKPPEVLKRRTFVTRGYQNVERAEIPILQQMEVCLDEIKVKKEVVKNAHQMMQLAATLLTNSAI